MTIGLHIAFGGINLISIGGSDLVVTEETTPALLGSTRPPFAPPMARMGSGDRVTPMKSLMEL